mmetsp:Transcript_51483/g.168337  ORF Transcript_51483/g.168337 Transcript_51483/m.168337 type:complete len:216 (+) Transcript_51483:61-708(+)
MNYDHCACGRMDLQAGISIIDLTVQNQMITHNSGSLTVRASDRAVLRTVWCRVSGPLIVEVSVFILHRYLRHSLRATARRRAGRRHKLEAPRAGRRRSARPRRVGGGIDLEGSLEPRRANAAGAAADHALPHAARVRLYARKGGRAVGAARVCAHQGRRRAAERRRAIRHLPQHPRVHRPLCKTERVDPKVEDELAVAVGREEVLDVLEHSNVAA